MKIINFLVAAVLLFFAWLQRNDIDPEIYARPSFDNPSLDSALWCLFYAVIGLTLIIQVFRRLPTWYFVLAILACFAEMAVSGPGLWQNLFGDQPFSMTQTSMSAADPRVELTREFFGALIALLAVAYQLWFQKKTAS